jgi:serine/threonine-protein kinase
MPDTFVPGGRFGGFEILEPLGAGGMGRVFRARDLALDRVVALKMLAPEISHDDAFVQRFQREARAVARLNHPNIVQIYAVGSVEGVHYLSMEYLDGRSLGHYLKTGHWPEREAVLIARQVCQALRVAHAAGLVHRDIKPDNLILTRQGEIKVVDLGIAKRVDEDQSMTQSGSAVGTPHYIAPEQVQGRRDIDGRADIYSLGATLYHLVTGHTPFKGTSGAHVMSMHLFAPLPDPRDFEPGLSEGICRVLRRMMAKERDERYPDVQALDLDLYRLQTGVAPEPPEPSATAIGSRFLAGEPGVDAGPTPTGFAPATLSAIEKNLAQEIGPLARVLVRQAARSAGSLEALYAKLAEQVAAGPARDAFLSRCRAQSEAAGATALTHARPAEVESWAVPAAGAPASTVLEGPVLSPADLMVVEAELARRIGPLAPVLVRRAARGATSRAELVVRLEDQIPDEAGRRAFRRAVLGHD